MKHELVTIEPLSTKYFDKSAEYAAAIDSAVGRGRWLSFRKGEAVPMSEPVMTALQTIVQDGIPNVTKISFTVADGINIFAIEAEFHDAYVVLYFADLPKHIVSVRFDSWMRSAYTPTESKEIH